MRATPLRRAVAAGRHAARRLRLRRHRRPAAASSRCRAPAPPADAPSVRRTTDATVALLRAGRAPTPRTVDEVEGIRDARPADRRRRRRHLSPRRAQPGRTGIIEGFDIDFVYAIADEIFAENGREALDERNRVELKVITAAAAHPAPRGRARRHRRAQHDRQLRALAADRVLRRVLPRRPEGAGRPHEEPGIDDRSSDLARTSGSARRPAPRASTTSRRSRARGDPGQLHRQLGLHGARSRTARPTASAPTTPCSPGSPPRTRTPRCSTPSRSPSEPYGIGVNSRTSDLVRLHQRRARGHARATAAGRRLRPLAAARAQRPRRPADARLRPMTAR